MALTEIHRQVLSWIRTFIRPVLLTLIQISSKMPLWKMISSHNPKSKAIFKPWASSQNAAVIKFSNQVRKANRKSKLTRIPLLKPTIALNQGFYHKVHLAINKMVAWFKKQMKRNSVLNSHWIYLKEKVCRQIIQYLKIL